VRFFSATPALLAALDGVSADTAAPAAESSPPALLLVDLGAPRADEGFALLEQLAVRRAARTAAGGSAGDAGTAVPPALAFYSHVEDEVRRRALALGAERVVPRSAFVARFEHWVRELTGRSPAEPPRG
jgi:CheY-like chemotaxis protein